MIASLRRRLEAEAGLADRLLDDLDLALVERRDDDDARLRRVDRRHLVERHQLAVHLDLDRVEHARRRLARADGRELVFDMGDVFVHRRARVFEDLLN